MGTPSNEEAENVGGRVRADTAVKQIGRVIDGRYRIGELVGSGGMGSVYRAEHVTIRRKVAIKLLHPALASMEELRKRFEREAYAIGRIQHENCVHVSDFGSLEDGSLYLVMEYLEGRSLGSILDIERRLDVERALHIIRHVVRGLGHAHVAGIVHRDVKPENVLLVSRKGDDNFAKILDFGIAKLMGDAQRDEVNLTQAGMAFGTPTYMSPEQAVGNAVDGRADLYAATILLFEMIAGDPPFVSDDKIEVLSMQTGRKAPRLSEVTGDRQLPAGLDELVAKGLSKQPANRFQTSDEYVAAIDRILTAIRTGTRAPAAPATAQAPPATTSVPITNPLELTNRAARRKLWWIAAVVILFAGATILSLELASGPQAPTTLADQAAERLRLGDPKSAIALLQKYKTEADASAAAQKQLGHAFAALGKPPKAMKAYARAVELNDSTRSDSEALRNLTALLGGKDANLAIDIAEFLHTTMKSATGAEKLGQLATSSSDRKIRQRARSRAITLGITKEVDFVSSYALDLQHGPSCQDRREAVAKLRALADKRAIPLLHKAQKQVGRSGRWRGQPINGCLVEEADAAIRYLESLE